MLLAARLGIDVPTVGTPPRIEEVTLRAARVAPPAALASLCSTTPLDRAGHTYGKSFRDVVRGFARDFANPPDVVAFPTDEAEVAALLAWCSDAGLAAIPYGGGSSVVGGVEAPPADRFPGVVSIDLGRLDRVLEIDRASRAARIQGGVLGPSLEDQLRPHGLTLRHFPQSFEFSTLGGWIATRSGGHYATLFTHIDEFVESLRVVTPTGTIATRRLPASGAGRAPIGSSSARKASSASSPRRGCDCRIGHRGARRRRSRSRASSPGPLRYGRSRRAASIPRTAGCSTRVRR